jgi:hypothetical protein
MSKGSFRRLGIEFRSSIRLLKLKGLAVSQGAKIVDPFAR